MQSISSREELREAIEVLETEQALKGQLLKEQFILTYDSLKPINVLRRTLKEITSGQSMADDIPGTIMGLVSGYLSRKILTGRSANIFRKLLGSALQIGVTNVVAKNSNMIRAVGLALIEHFLHRKNMTSKNHAG